MSVGPPPERALLERLPAWRRTSPGRRCRPPGFPESRSRRPSGRWSGAAVCRRRGRGDGRIGCCNKRRRSALRKTPAKFSPRENRPRRWPRRRSGQRRPTFPCGTAAASAAPAAWGIWEADGDGDQGKRFNPSACGSRLRCPSSNEIIGRLRGSPAVRSESPSPGNRGRSSLYCPRPRRNPLGRLRGPGSRRTSPSGPVSGA